MSLDEFRRHAVLALRHCLRRALTDALVGVADMGDDCVRLLVAAERAEVRVAAGRCPRRRR